MSGSSSIKNELGPDFHGYYKHHFLELFPQNGGHVSPPFESDLEPLLGYQTGEAETVITPKNGQTDKSYHPPISFFARVIGEELSEYKKEKLKAILHQTVGCLNQEADELCQLEQNVEEYLDMVVSKCRPMTLAEKRQLGRKIQKLPEKALDRVVEILQCSNSSRSSLANTISVNLEELDDVILWRLYYFVQSVAKANEL